VDDLQTGLASAEGGGEQRLVVVRGVDEREVVVPVAAGEGS
jgi:hypothetical protein